MADNVYRAVLIVWWKKHTCYDPHKLVFSPECSNSSKHCFLWDTVIRVRDSIVIRLAEAAEGLKMKLKTNGRIEVTQWVEDREQMFHEKCLLKYWSRGMCSINVAYYPSWKKHIKMREGKEREDYVSFVWSPCEMSK